MSSSSGITSSGAQANLTGKTLERFVERVLQDNGFTHCSLNKTTAFKSAKDIENKQYIKQMVAGDTIYGTPRQVDFFIKHGSKFPRGLIIECKWQQAGGSVDEKFPFLIFNILRTKIPTIILLDGGGYRPNAKEWLRSQVNPRKYLIGVWSMAELQKEANKGVFL